MNLYGIERATADIDMVIKLDKKNVARFIKSAKRLKLKPKIPVALEDFADEEKRNGWRKEKKMIVFSLYDKKEPYMPVDVFVYEPFDFDFVYSRRCKIKFSGTTLSVISPAELIAMKKKTGRVRDKSDAYYLDKISKEMKK